MTSLGIGVMAGAIAAQFILDGHWVVAALVFAGSLLVAMGQHHHV